MPLISLVLILAIVGFLLYLIETKIPMDDTVKVAIRVIVLIAVVLFVLNLFGLLDSLDTIRVGRPR